MEAIHRDVVLAHVGRDLVFGPVGDGIQLDDAAVGLVDLHLGGVGAGDVLVPAQPGDPGVDVREVAGERLDLANPAAPLALLDGLVEEVQALLAHHRLDVGGAREDDLDLLVVAVAHAIHEVVGLLGEPPRVQGEDPRRRIDALHHVEQHHAFPGAEGAREREPGGKILDCPAQDFGGAPALGFTRVDELQHFVINRVFRLYGHSSHRHAENIVENR